MELITSACSRFSRHRHQKFAPAAGALSVTADAWASGNDKPRKGRHPIQDAGRSGAAEFQLRRDLKDHAAAAVSTLSCAAIVCRAIEVAARVEDHAAWSFLVVAAGRYLGLRTKRIEVGGLETFSEDIRAGGREATQ